MEMIAIARTDDWEYHQKRLQCTLDLIVEAAVVQKYLQQGFIQLSYVDPAQSPM